LLERRHQIRPYVNRLFALGGFFHRLSVDIEFTAHNPGDWFFHCHKPMHMEGGMITLAKIV
jgi:FtsP/CotA-like multicopper oxidase with cupredoxin domain